ncbi:MAG TPA: hypothetical protein VGJ02_06160 [Pyrinomonadaceae bacterium]
MTDRKVFENSISRFISWLDRNGTAGYDPYDLWSTRYGIRARRMFYRYGKLAAPMVAPLVLVDRLMPSAARKGLAKKRYATSHAHLILAYLDLHSGDFGERVDLLGEARLLAEELDEIKIAGFSGDCWGYPFDWENRRGLWPKNTPLITVTPYSFEALLALYETTGDAIHLERARSVLNFATHDLNDIERPNGTIASSYSPLDHSLVINASAYRAFVLIKGGELFGDTDAKGLGAALFRFVLDSQRANGSWPYALEAERDDFVDHFHTCFVLKNLAKIFSISGEAQIGAAIESGYAFYEENLFDGSELPMPFAEGGNRLLRYSMYDFAEAINLGVLLRDLIPRAFGRAVQVGLETVERFQLPDGHFVTSVGRTGSSDKLPFIRWPQAQMFHALASLWRTLN